jgi:aminoglycoside 6-adenylyltransferase
MSDRASYDQLLSRIVDWAEARTDVRAIGVVGSRARSVRPADAWSDLDLVVLAKHPRRLRESDDWIRTVGTPWLVCLKKAPVADQPMLQVTYPGGRKVDFAIVSSRAFPIGVRAESLLRRHPRLGRLLPAGVRTQLGHLSDLLGAGFRLVVDKDGLAGALARAGTPPRSRAAPPGPEEFTHLVHEFLNHQISTTLKLGRGELFYARTQGEALLMEPLVRMLEWHAGSKAGWKAEILHDGRLLEEWADPSAVESLHAIFPAYDTVAVWRARLAAADLFRRIGEETAGLLGYRYPAELHTQIMGWVEDLSGSAGVGQEDPT